MKKKITLFNTIIVIFSVSIFCLSIYNYKTSKNEFWDFNVFNLITVIIALVFSLYYVQRKNDNLRKKQKIENIIAKVAINIEELIKLNIDSKDTQKIYLDTQRRVRNSISALRLLKESVTNDVNNTTYGADLDYVDVNFKQYINFVSENFYNFDSLFKNKSELERILGNVLDRLDLLSIHLYI